MNRTIRHRGAVALFALGLAAGAVACAETPPGLTTTTTTTTTEAQPTTTLATTTTSTPDGGGGWLPCGSPGGPGCME